MTCANRRIGTSRDVWRLCTRFDAFLGPIHDALTGASSGIGAPAPRSELIR